MGVRLPRFELWLCHILAAFLSKFLNCSLPTHLIMGIIIVPISKDLSGLNELPFIKYLDLHLP